MSKKSKAVVFDSARPYGIGMYEDSKARLKHQTLLQDYEELQKETDVTRSKLESAKQRKMMLASEVRFLRRRYKYLVKTKNMNSSYNQNLVQAPNMPKQTKIAKEQLLTRKEANSTKKHCVVKQVNASPLTDQSHKRKSYSLVSDSNHRVVLHARKEYPGPNPARRNPERIFGANDASLTNSASAFDLNQDSIPSRKEASLPTRAPIFDLNEISTGNEEFQVTREVIELEEAKKSSSIRGVNEEQQSDLKLSICRNSGESSTRTGKRKISWQDPVALRV